MVIQYKCPNCGSDMRFNAKTGTLSCPSCGRQDHIEDFSDEFIEKKFDGDEVAHYECNNCGAEIITDPDTTATNCSFCGAPVVLGDRLTGELAPAKVIPFSISKDEAIRAFKKWCRNGLLTPRGFMAADRIKEITGIYVPFWMYDLDSNANVEAVGTKVRTYTRGDYIYTETRFYNVYRDIDMSYMKVPVDASEKLNDELMDKLEPYKYGDLKEFKSPYLAGYIAEKYNFTDDELFERVKTKVQPFIDSYVKSTVNGYATVNYKRKDIRTNKKKALYVLLPVWMVYYDYEDQEHIFAMNGQTGKVVGKPPLSRGKMAAWFSGIAGSTFLAFKLLTFAISGVIW